MPAKHPFCVPAGRLMLAGGLIPRMTTKPFPRHGVTVQNGSELIALSAVKPLEASLRDGSRGGVMVWELDLDLRFIWELGIGNFRSGLVGGVEFPQTNFQISSKTKFQGPNEAEGDRAIKLGKLIQKVAAKERSDPTGPR